LRSFLAVDLAVVFSVVGAGLQTGAFLFFFVLFSRPFLNERRIRIPPTLSRSALGKSFYDYILRPPDSIDNVACYIW